MANELGLNEQHQNLVLNYLRFAKFQRTQRIRSVEKCFEDVESLRLLEDTYTADEVKSLVDELCSLVRGEVETELINSAHTTALLLRQLCTQGERWHLRLHEDISELENRELIEQISKFEERELKNIDKGSKSPIKAVKLEPILEGQGQVKLLQAEINRLKAENEALKERLKRVEQQTFNIIEEKNKLSKTQTEMEEELKDLKGKASEKENVTLILDQVSKEKSEIEETLVSNTALQKQLEDDLLSTKNHLTEVQAHLELAEKELERKFCENGSLRQS
ncbi:leucine zipper transcription factor-like protein 1 [Centruroides vittatus]|uniref:leucine zipper transcription factor-like protein 1 n=1 Tax=Centruroides vittatus TaxID=120091 RepID=UPI003510CED9